MEDKKFEQLISDLTNEEKASCPDSELLELYIDNKLKDSQKKIIGAHLEKCPFCKKELELIKKYSDPNSLEDMEKEVLSLSKNLPPLPDELREKIKSLKETKREINFYNIACDLVRSVYPTEIDRFELSWQNSFNDKNIEDIVDEAAMITKSQKCRTKDKHMRIISGVGYYWNDIEKSGHQTDEIDTRLRRRLRKAGISGRKSKKISRYIKKII